ncbi:MAG: type I-E CRISPR-associated protein Cse1/CasA [Acidaminococcales bacterium]|nr:type I-E CRISPR-associated protein Cse1/CasA [Acidaminococcales bacterium]
MAEKDFNLLFEQWIRVLNGEGEAEEISLLDFFRRAHELKSIAGELATQDVAMLRLLLAVVYAVFTRVDADGKRFSLKNMTDALGRWKQIWKLDKFPYEVIEKYFKHYHDRFYLFHPERPFYQVPALNIGTDYFAAKLMGDLSESGNKVRLFPIRTGKGKGYVGKAEAARWLLHLNAFDDASSKPKGEGLPSPGTGWLGKLGIVFAVGANMFETLMLNFALADEHSNVFEEGKAAWEQEKANKEERVKISAPTSMLELLTLQSRRIMLLKTPDGGYISGYRLLGGDFFDEENAFIEQMTLWRAKKEKNNIIFLPKFHDPARFLWQDFPALTVKNSEHKQPGIVHWIAVLKSHGLTNHKLASFQTASIKYGANNSAVADAFSDYIKLNAGLLTELGGEYAAMVVDLLDKTAKCVKVLGDLANDIAEAGGSDAKNINGIGEQVREQAYFSLDKPFRNWLADVDPGKNDIAVVAGGWLQQMKKIVTTQGQQIFAEAGEKAFVGRYKEVKGKRVAQTAARAFLRFEKEIMKITG